MHNALRMNDNFHALHLDAEKPMGFDHLQPFIEKRSRIDCNLGPHVPSRMFQRLLRGDGIKIFSGRFPERPA